MIFTKAFDIHSIIHFVGCYALVPTLMVIFGLPVFTAGIIAMFLAGAWEILDEFNCKKSWKIWFLDPRGGDALDTLTDAAGIILAFLIF